MNSFVSCRNSQNACNRQWWSSVLQKNEGRGANQHFPVSPARMMGRPMCHMSQCPMMGRPMMEHHSVVYLTGCMLSLNVSKFHHNSLEEHRHRQCQTQYKIMRDSQSFPKRRKPIPQLKWYFNFKKLGVSSQKLGGSRFPEPPPSGCALEAKYSIFVFNTLFSGFCRPLKSS